MTLTIVVAIAILIVIGLVSDFKRLGRHTIKQQRLDANDAERPKLRRFVNWLLAPFGIF